VAGVGAESRDDEWKKNHYMKPKDSVPVPSLPVAAPPVPPPRPYEYEIGVCRTVDLGYIVPLRAVALTGSERGYGHHFQLGGFEAYVDGERGGGLALGQHDPCVRDDYSL
jgi:hypothetical protein